MAIRKRRLLRSLTIMRPCDRGLFHSHYLVKSGGVEQSSMEKRNLQSDLSYKYRNIQLKAMFQNYLKTAWRNLLKYRAYSVINIFGLMMGIACFLVIALYVFDELTFDSFHRNAENIYRVVEERTSETGEQTKVASVSYQIAQQAPAQLPGVVGATRISVRGRVLVKSKPGDKGFQ